jgi:hypothetical protein
MLTIRRVTPAALLALSLFMAVPARAAVRTLLVPMPAAAELAAEDAVRDEDGQPWRFAVPNDVRATLAADGVWERLPDGSRRWRLDVESPGALTLNLGFTVFWLPRGATLTLRRPTAEAPEFTFDNGDNADHGQLWTPVVPGDALVVELTVPAGARLEPLLELGFVGAGYRGLGESPAAKSGLCNVDVACPEGDGWRAEIDAVGLVTINGSLICSGALVNNTAYDGKPYFLTANHCSITGPAAPSVVIYWNYQSPTCGQHGGGTLTQFTSGSTLRASWSGSDFTLIELDELPDPAYGVTYAGWNRGSELPSSAVAIHHPNCDEKSISFENDVLHLASYLATAEPGDSSHLRIVDWDTGTTEPGSSGSPLFDQDHLVVGQLHGGYAACGNSLSDWYGWLNRSWDGGGTPDTALMGWLDTAGTGAVTVPLMDPAAGEFTVVPVADISDSVSVGGPFTADGWDFRLLAVGSEPFRYTASVDQDWLAVSPAQGFVSDGADTVTVSLAPGPASRLPVGLHTATLTLTNPSLGTTVTRAIALEVLPDDPTTIMVGPNPFRDYTVWRLTLPQAGQLAWSVYDLGGRLVRGPVTRNLAAGVSEIAWDGRDDSGRRLPSGTYVWRVEALGREIRVRVSCSR